MPDRDELDQLWRSQPTGMGVKGEDMLAIAIRKSRQFDRKIRIRNLVECTAAAVVSACFAISAAAAPNALMRSGDAVVAAAGLWIILYIMRYGREAPEPSPDQSLAGFQRDLLRKYEYQIRLLKRVKYWYLLPPYAGLLLLSAGIIKAATAAGRNGAILYAVPVIVSAVFGVVWWMNEVIGVRHLDHQRTRLLQALK